MADSAAPAAAVPFVFALTPFDVHPDKVINYSTEWGLEFWKISTEPLQFKFDGSPDKLFVFLTLVRHEIRRRRWRRINEVADADPSGDGDSSTTLRRVCWVDQHDNYTVEDLRRGLDAEIFGETRHAQDSDNMYHFLAHSLTLEFFGRVSDCKVLYTVNGHEIGPIFLKVILSLASRYHDDDPHHQRAQVVLLLPRRRFVGATTRGNGRRRRRIRAR